MIPIPPRNQAGFEYIIDYLQITVTDPFPRYILKKELLRESPIDADYDDIHSSKWYLQLTDEQWDDGSWGRFHSMDSRIKDSQKFVSTEAALRRANELGITKNDPVIAKCITLMERYVRGENTWRDYIEKHKDNGKGHLFCRPFLTAANINMFDPENPVIQPLRDIVVETLKTAFSTGSFDENFWEQKVKEYHVPSITTPGNAYGFMLLQKSDCMEDTLQRQYLYYIWNRKEGINYISNFAPAEKYRVEDKRFTTWLSALELLSGFSLFSESVKEDVFPHLLCEINRLLNDDVKLPAAHPITGHYAESWRNKTARKNDMILRILRVLVKC